LLTPVEPTSILASAARVGDCFWAKDCSICLLAIAPDVIAGRVLGYRFKFRATGAVGKDAKYEVIADCAPDAILHRVLSILEVMALQSIPVRVKGVKA
jgi:hypothetical protein